MVTHQVACLEVGMNDYLAKPINTRDLIAKIARWTEPRSPGGLSGGEEAVLEEDSSSVIVLEEAMAHMGGDEELFQTVMRVFLEDARDRLGIIERGAEASDWGVVREGAHRIKGAAASVAAARVRGAAEALERVSARPVLSEVLRLLGVLGEELERVAEWVRENT
jgi:HPt (histidine-containing phosphotransfer) domain-containing protein